MEGEGWRDGGVVMFRKFDDWLWSFSVPWQRVVIAALLVAMSFGITVLVVLLVYAAASA